MAKLKEPTNPFYVLLVILGVVFSITACAYGLMALKSFNPAAAQANSAAGQQLLAILDRWGVYLLLGELVLLAIATFAAMATDQYWSRRGESQRSEIGGRKSE